MMESKSKRRRTTTSLLGRVSAHAAVMNSDEKQDPTPSHTTKSRYTPVRRVNIASYDEYDRVRLDHAPVMLVEAACDWDALKEWSPRNAEDCFPPALVTVGLGPRQSHLNSSEHVADQFTNPESDQHSMVASSASNVARGGSSREVVHNTRKAPTIHETQLEYITTTMHEFARWCRDGTRMRDYGSLAQSAKRIHHSRRSCSQMMSSDASYYEVNTLCPHSPDTHFGYVSYTSLSDIFPSAAFSMAQSVLDWNDVLSRVDIQYGYDGSKHDAFMPSDADSTNTQRSASNVPSVESRAARTTLHRNESAEPTENEEHARATNFWFGTEDAVTQCHYDSYGCNFVTQIYGRKRYICGAAVTTNNFMSSFFHLNSRVGKHAVSGDVDMRHEMIGD